MVTYICVMKYAMKNKKEGKEIEDNVQRTAILVDWSGKASVWRHWYREMNEVEEKTLCIFQVPQEEKTGSAKVLRKSRIYVF